jgi:hypothetical protein
MTASFRAIATLALRSPLGFASRMPQALSADHLTEAAHGSLKPPTKRLRRVLLHLSYSTGFRAFLTQSPVNASRRPSRDAAHHSWSEWLARPSPRGTCTSYSLPANWRTPSWTNSRRVSHNSFIDAGTAKLCNATGCWLLRSRLSDREVADASHFHQPFEPRSADRQGH